MKRSRCACLPQLLLACLCLLAARPARAADFDGDGFPDSSDNCPWVANDQADRGRVGSSLPDGIGDACQCGDVNGDGQVRSNDLLLLKRARLGAPAQLSAPSRCNVIGPVDATAGLRVLTADCNLGDTVVIARALHGQAPGVGQFCAAATAPGDDDGLPSVSILAPLEGQSIPTGPADIAILIDTAPATDAGTGLDLDRDGSDDRILDVELAAALRLIDELDPASARMALVVYGRSQRVVQPLTADRQALHDAVAEIRASTGSSNTPASGAVLAARDLLLGPAARPHSTPVIVLFSASAGVGAAELSGTGVVLHGLHFGDRVPESGLTATPVATGGIYRSVGTELARLPDAALALPVPEESLVVLVTAQDAVAVERVGVRAVDELGAAEEVILETAPYRVRLPNTRTGRIEVSASAVDRGGHRVDAGPVTIDAVPAAHAPEIDSLTPPRGVAGTTVTLRGRYFAPATSTTAGYSSGAGLPRVLSANQVTVSGVPALVRSASKTQLQVDIPAGIGSSDLVVEVAGRRSAPVRFEIDADADGLADERELERGSDPELADSDGDGLADGEEVDSLGTDPLNADSDGDGIGDGREKQLGLDALSSADGEQDRDRDGLSNAAEVAAGSDPDDPDSDGDGLLDVAEVEIHGTSPARADTDGGGRDDAGELLDDRTDPLERADDARVVTRSVVLEDQLGFDWEIFAASFAVYASSTPAVNRAVELGIGGAGYGISVDRGVLSADGRSVRAGPVLVDGLRVTRHFFVPADGSFVRMLDVFENPGPSRTWDVRAYASPYYGHFLWRTAEGNTQGGSLRTAWTAYWSDTTGHGAFFVAGPVGSPPPLSASVFSTDTNWPHRFTLPQGGRVALLHFAGQRGAQADVIAAANTLASLQGGALAGIPDELLALVQNFPAFPDADRDGLRDADETLRGTDPNRVDSDGDGLSDGFEVRMGLDPLAGGDQLGDLDGDGVSNGVEAALGTDPRRSDSDGDGLRDGDETATSPVRSDSDGDRLPDGVERDHLGTDPLSADSDGDGLPDGQELLELGTDPLAADTDGDGLDDASEHNDPWFDPTDPGDVANDTDQDGLTDAREPAIGTRRDDPDSDRDGLLDGEEVDRWSSDPLRQDSDGGGRSDFVEIMGDHTNPRVASDDLPRVALPFELVDGAGVRWPVGWNGQPVADAFSNYAFELGVVYSFYGFDSAVLDGGDLRFGPVQANGVMLERRLRASPDGFIRILDHITNLRSTPAELQPSFRSTPRASARMRVLATSSGDAAFAVDDDFVVVDDDVPAGDVPAALVVLGGPGARYEPELARAETSSYSAELRHSFALQLAPGERASFLHFSAIRPSGDELLPLATVLRNLAGSSLDGLSAGDRASIVNFPVALDRDGDGLRDDEETALGTDPLRADSDGDGLDDGFEVRAELDPLAPGQGHLDLDGDGLSVDQEFALGTDPLSDDSDRDGLTDGAEHQGGATDPARFDTDGDRLGDGLEQLLLRIDPTARDSDQDGLEDGRELLELRTDPASADSDGDGLPDGYEAGLWWLNPRDPVDGTKDQDSDGLPNAGEWTAGTNLTDRDTDDDGLPDGLEVSSGASPLLADTDGGGTGDREEVLRDATDPRVPSDDLQTVPLPATLDARWQVTTNAAISDVSPTPLFSFFALPSIAGYSLYERNAVVEDGGRGLRVGPYRFEFASSYLEPVRMQTQVYVPPGESFVRVLTRVHNAGTSPIALDVRLRMSPRAPVATTSSGDTALTVDDDYVVLANEAGAGAWVFSTASSAPLQPGVAASEYGTTFLQWHLQLEPGEARSLLSFGTVAASAEAAHAQAEELRRLRGPARPGSALEGLDAAELFELANFPGAIDADLDGLSDARELEIGTDPVRADSDEDGLPDGYEALLGFDPLLRDADADADADGLSNAEELARGTNAIAGDSDGDGLLDGEELAFGSDPLRTDTDGDVIDDLWEWQLGSSPTSRDSDGDGLDDRFEVETRHTDPTSTDSDGDGIGDKIEEDQGWLDPLDPLDAFEDVDEDGLNALEEIALGTQIASRDTDLDGLPDGDEVRIHGTSPTQADSDGGGRRDDIELRVDGTDPRVASDEVPSIALPAVFADGAGISWEIGGSGSARQSSMLEQAGGLLLAVGFRQFGSGFSSSTRFEGRELQLDPSAVPEDAPQVLHERRVRVSSTGSFVRYLDSVENLTDSPIDLGIEVSADVRWGTNVTSGIETTSSGDAQPDTGDDWVAMRSIYSTRRALVVFSGPGAQTDPTSVVEEQRYGGSGWVMRTTFAFNVRVQPRARLSFLHFVGTAEADRVPSAAEDLRLLRGAALEGLSAEDAASVVNFFAFADADQDGLADVDEVSAGTDPANPDSDGDGLSDGFEVRAGLDPTTAGDPQDDLDGDGISDALEALLGLDPAARDTDRDGLEDGTEHFVLGTDPRRADTDLDGLGDGAEVSVHGTSPASADSDGDGIDDGGELRSGTDPTRADTDGDGISDSLEWVYRLDPLLASDGALDPDRDGLSNARELQRGTRIDIADSDADGLGDGDEVDRYGTDPVDPDTDGGGRTDRHEILEDGTDPLAAGDDVASLTLSRSLFDGAGQAVEISWSSVWIDGVVATQPGNLVPPSVPVFGSSQAVILSPEEVRIGPYEATGLRLWQRLAVPRQMPVSRRLIIVENPSDQARTAQIAIEPPVQARSSVYGVQLVTTSSGDSTLDSNDDWAIEQGGQSPPIYRAGIWAGRGASQRPAYVRTTQVSPPPFPSLPPITTTTERLVFQSTIPGHGAVAILLFEARATVGDGATRLAGSARELPASLLVGLEPQLATSVLNFFAFPDTDGDRLADAEEIAAGTDPAVADGDGDGLTDGFEVRAGQSPHTPDDPGADPDGDGLDNALEQQAGTDPRAADTDGDGLDDREEVRVYGSDPLHPDGDGDGLGDRDEVRAHHSDPRAADGDSDGLLDPEEIAIGTDPLRADTDGDGVGDTAEKRALELDPLDPGDASLDADRDGLSNREEIDANTELSAADSDADGLGDREELSLGTDPRDSDTDNGGRRDGAEVLLQHTDPKAAGDDGGSPYLVDRLRDGNARFWSLSSLGFTIDGTPVGSGAFRIDATGRELIRDPVVIRGLTAYRRLYVPAREGFARYLDVFENRTARELGARITYKAPFDDSLHTSSGGPELTTEDDFYVVARTDEAQLRLYSGPRAALEPVATSSGQTDPTGQLELGVSFDLTIAAGERVALLVYAAAHPEAAAALEEGAGLRSLPASALARLDPDLRSRIANFRAETDSDADGVADVDESAAGIDPSNADSDGDGLRDGFELDAGLDPARPDDPLADADGDGLSTAAEQLHASRPSLSDSDADGLGDGQEVLLGISPVVSDSDGDGLSDAYEVALGSDPLHQDSDGGGWPDGREVLDEQADPTDPADDFVRVSSAELTDASGASWKIFLSGITTPAGSLSTGSLSELRLQTSSGIARLRTSGQGFELLRTISAAPGRPFLRVVDVLRNTGSVPLARTLSHYGTSLVSTSAGSAIPDSSDHYWILSKDAAGAAPFLLEVFREAGPEPAVARFIQANGSVSTLREWALELAPGQSAVVLGFVAQVESVAAAQALAATLLPPDAGALEGLDPEQTARALNFPSLH